MIPYKDNPRIDHRKRQSDRYYRRTGFRRPSERHGPEDLTFEELSTPLPPPMPIPVTPEPENRDQRIPIRFTEQRDPLRIEITRTDRTGQVRTHVVSGDQVLIAFMLVLFVLGTILFLGAQP